MARILEDFRRFLKDNLVHVQINLALRRATVLTYAYMHGKNTLNIIRIGMLLYLLQCLMQLKHWIELISGCCFRNLYLEMFHYQARVQEFVRGGGGGAKSENLFFFFSLLFDFSGGGEQLRKEIFFTKKVEK